MTMTQQAGTTVITPGMSRGQDAVITLRVPAEFGCRRHAHVAGDFTAWTPVAMAGEPAGGFSITLCLPRERTWQYRFLVDGDLWMNDPGADDYVRAAANGGAVSVLST